MIVSLSVDVEVYEAARTKYPQQISSLFNDFLKSLLLTSDKERDIDEKQKEVDELQIQEQMIKLKKEKTLVEIQKIRSDTERELKEHEEQERLLKQTCLNCKEIKEEKEIQQFGGICRTCFRSLSVEDLKKYIK